MKKLISLELEGLPPTVNNMYRNVGHRRYKTLRSKKYQERVTELLSQEWKKKKPCRKAIEFRIKFRTKDRRKWDIDNRVKALQDCLSMAGIIKDDSQIEVLHVEREKGNKTTTYIEVISDDISEGVSGGTKTMEDKQQSREKANKAVWRRRKSARTLREDTK